MGMGMTVTNPSRVRRGIATLAVGAVLACTLPARAQGVDALTRAQQELEMLDYAGAADAYESAAHDAHLARDERGDAAARGAKLSAMLDDRERTQRLATLAVALGAPDRAALDYLVPLIDEARWRRATPGPNERRAHAVAKASLTNFFATHRRDRAPSPFVVDAASRMARLEAETGEHDADAWRQKTIDAWREIDRLDPRLSRARESLDAAAEAADAMVADDANRTIPEPWTTCRSATYASDVAAAGALDDRFSHVESLFQSRRWSAVEAARAGMLYDALASGLYWCSTSPAQMHAMQAYSAWLTSAPSLVATLPPGVSALVATAHNARTQRQARIDDASGKAIVRYARALELARGEDVPTNGAVNLAARRFRELVETRGRDSVRAALLGKSRLSLHDLEQIAAGREHLPTTKQLELTMLMPPPPQIGR